MEKFAFKVDIGVRVGLALVGEDQRETTWCPTLPGAREIGANGGRVEKFAPRQMAKTYD
jgi:hypothetical protein